MDRNTNLKKSRTYSKAKEMTSKEIFREKLKKTVPDFESLFLNSSKKNCISTPKLKKSSQTTSTNHDSSPELFGTEDSFDVIAKYELKSKNKLVPLKDFLDNVASSESSSSSIPNEVIFTLFEPSPKKDSVLHNGKTEERMLNRETSSLKFPEKISMGSKVDTLLNVITSTPTTENCVKDYKENILNNEFSPVSKDLSFPDVDDFSLDLFESNSDNDKMIPISSSGISQEIQVDTPSSSKYVVNSLLSSLNKSTSVYNDTFSTFLSVKPSKYQRITRRKKILAPENSQLNSISTFSFCKKDNSRLAIDMMDIKNGRSYFSVEDKIVKESLSQSVLLPKPGKGYRRSIKKILNMTHLQCTDSTSKLFTTCMESHITKEITEDKEEPITDYRKEILKLCHQDEEIWMEIFFSDKLIENCKKIGEGVYGEVFMYKHHAGCSEAVLKIIPIEGSLQINGEIQKTCKEMIPEIIISRCLSDLNLNKNNSCPSFVGMNRSYLLQGKYSLRLLELWDEYNNRKESENDRPDSFPTNQLYLALEYGFAGEDLEKYIFNNAKQAYSVWLQIAYALSIGEEVFEFEHRDLHWGNVLVKRIEKASLSYCLRGRQFFVKTCGVMASIIDFTLSRLKSNNRIYFSNLSQENDLFIAEGDYQFEIYRMMKNNNGNNWEEFHPRSNVYWLHYLILKIIKDCYYRNTNTKIHREALKELQILSEKILIYDSATELVLNFSN